MAEQAAMSPTVPKIGEMPKKTVWYGVGKFLENNSPSAHSDRMIGVLNKLLPKLKPTQQEWIIKHRNAIETASVVAGVGVTTAEIVLTTAFAIDVVKMFRSALSRIPRSLAQQPQGMSRTDSPATVMDKTNRKQQDITFYRSTDEFLAAEMMADPKWPPGLLPGTPNREWLTMLTDPGSLTAEDMEKNWQKYQEWLKLRKQREPIRLAAKGRRMDKRLTAKAEEVRLKVGEVLKGYAERRDKHNDLLKIARENQHAVNWQNNQNGYRVRTVLDQAAKEHRVGAETKQWLTNVLAKTEQMAKEKDAVVLKYLADIQAVQGDTIYSRVDKTGIAARLFEYIFKKLPKEQRTSAGLRHIDGTLFSTMGSVWVQEMLQAAFEHIRP